MIAALAWIGIFCALLALALVGSIAKAVDTIARELGTQTRLQADAAAKIARAATDYDEARLRLHASYGEAIKRYEIAADDYHTRAAMLAAPSGPPS